MAVMAAGEGNMIPRHEIKLLAGDVGEDMGVAAAVTAMINDVYAVAEQGLWLDGAHRASIAAVTEAIQREEIAVALSQQQMIGCVRVRCVDDDISEFGMLAVPSSQRGNGVGGDLVRFAERLSLATGRTEMQLELLVPRTWRHPSKSFLADWYHRIGYRVLRTGTIDEMYPELSTHLATACDFITYHKNLRSDAEPAGLD